MFAQPRTNQQQPWSANQHPITMTNNWCAPSQTAHGLRLGVFALVLSFVLALTGQGAPQTAISDVNNYDKVVRVQIDPSCSPFASLTDCFNEVK
jgi:hypothetical protein